MNQENSHQELTEEVLDQIKAGQVKMLPKWHFVFKTILVTTGVIILSLFLLYAVSLMIFTLRQSGAWFGPSFGSGGWLALLADLPWLLGALTLIFLIALFILVKHFAFSYRRPFIYSILILIILAAVGGVAVDWTHFHKQLFKEAENNHLPLAGGFYRQVGRSQFPNIHRGLITGVMPQGFFLKNQQGEVLQVIVTPSTSLPLDKDFETGDGAVVFGDRQGLQIKALGVRRVGPEE